MEKKSKVLIVEDDKQSLLFLSDLLKLDGYNILTAESGEIALSLLTKKLPDLILLDIILPGINGFEVCRKIKENNTLVHTPVIFLSGNYKIEDKLKGFNLGAVDFISKPFHRKELLARIKNHVKLNNYNKLFKEKNAEKIIENEQFLLKKNIELFKKNEQLQELKLNLEHSKAEIKQQLYLFEHIFKHSLDCLVLLDKDYNFIKVSQSYADVCQRDILEFEGNNHFDFYPSSLKDEFDEAKKNKAVYSKKARPFTFPDHPEWGVTYWDLGLVPVLDNKNEIELFIFTLKNVTDEITSKQKLKNEKEKAEKRELELNKLSQGIEQSPICIIITNTKGDIEYVNKQFYILTGHKPKDVIGKNPKILNAGTHPKSYYENLWKTILSGNIWRGEFQNKKANGEIYWEDAIITPIKDKKGRITHFVAVKDDITEKKNLWLNLYSAKKKVEQSEALFNAFMENVPIFTYIEDKNHEPIYRNSKTWNLFKESEFNPFMTSQLFNEEQSNILKKAAEKIFNGKSEFEEVEFCTNLNNKLLNNIWLKDIKFPIRLPNGETLLGGMAIDITQEKQAKEKLLTYQSNLEKTVNSRTIELKTANKKLKSINQNLKEQKQVLEQTIKDLHKTQAQLVQSEKMASLGVLVAGVAHEINNPVNFINSSLSGLKNNLDYLSDYINFYKNINEDNYKIILDGLSKKEASLDDVFKMFSKSINIIEVGVKRTTKIVKGLKSFARAGEKEIEEYDIHENLENTLLILYNQYKNNIELTKIYGQIPLIRCYPGQINQVLMNLLINAIQAIKKTGQITIKTGTISSKQVFIEIMDTGIGIPESKIPLIFDPFFTTKKVGKGTGLGLSICYNIIKEHNGSISVKSSPGNGSSFKIVLPITQSD